MSLCNLLSAALSDAFDASRSCKHVCAFRLMECQSDDGHSALSVGVFSDLEIGVRIWDWLNF